MCGLVAVVRLGGNLTRPRASLPSIKTALYTIRHRGPDECAEYRDSDVVFGAVRLALVDLVFWDFCNNICQFRTHAVQQTPTTR
jgi:asparagine synthetase B (glutamine-hydrolysing)